MAKQFKYEISEIIGTLSESDKSDWAKTVSKISWNGNVPQIDIRNMNLSNIDNNDKGVLFGKGITLTDIEVENLLRILLSEGYLDDDEVMDIINNRNDVFKINKPNKKKIKIKRS